MPTTYSDHLGEAVEYLLLSILIINSCLTLQDPDFDFELLNILGTFIKVNYNTITNYRTSSVSSENNRYLERLDSIFINTNTLIFSDFSYSYINWESYSTDNKCV